MDTKRLEEIRECWRTGDHTTMRRDLGDLLAAYRELSERRNSADMNSDLAHDVFSEMGRLNLRARILTGAMEDFRDMAMGGVQEKAGALLERLEKLEDDLKRHQKE